MQPSSLIPSIRYQNFEPCFCMDGEGELPGSQLTSSAQIEEANLHRTALNFLTLGIPLLIKAISMIWQGIVHREKTGPIFRARFNKKILNTEDQSQLAKYQRVCELPFRPLKKVEQEKAYQLINQITAACQLSLKEDKFIEAKICENKLKALHTLLEKNGRYKTTRADFDEEDWKILDCINFEILSEQLETVNSVFNADWFKNPQALVSLKTNFGFDYDEAALAEFLSFDLPYIEGLDGKKIMLPIKDKINGGNRLVLYTIKANRLGDALPCYVLESSDPDAHPWLAIRGTQHYTKLSGQGKEMRVASKESVYADFIDEKCLSRRPINQALVTRPIYKEGDKLVQRESLGDIFRRWREEKKTAILCGHSWAATTVNTLSVEFDAQVEHVYGFNPAGGSQETYAAWKLLVQDEFGNIPLIDKKRTNFLVEGEPVPASGDQLIGTLLAVTDLESEYRDIAGVPEKQKGFTATHNRRHLRRDFQLQMVDRIKENSKFARVFCERLRGIIGKILKCLSIVFSRDVLPDWHRKHKFFLEVASHYRHIRELFFVSAGTIG